MVFRHLHWLSKYMWGSQQSKRDAQTHTEAGEKPLKTIFLLTLTFNFVAEEEMPCLSRYPGTHGYLYDINSWGYHKDLCWGLEKNRWARWLSKKIYKAFTGSLCAVCLSFMVWQCAISVQVPTPTGQWTDSVMSVTQCFVYEKGCVLLLQIQVLICKSKIVTLFKS